MIVPKQQGTSDSCTTTNEEEIYHYQDQLNLITIGWIHVCLILLKTVLIKLTVFIFRRIPRKLHSFPVWTCTRIALTSCLCQKQLLSYVLQSITSKYIISCDVRKKINLYKTLHTKCCVFFPAFSHVNSCLSFFVRASAINVHLIVLF